MTFGPASILAIVAAVLATLVWWLISNRPGLTPTLATFLFGFFLALVILAGPLIKLP
jgi:uncharacterized membrane protein YczE